MADSLSTAELAIYAVLSLPVLYILYYHFRVGLLGWVYLFAFCTLRIVGGAMSSSSSGNIISSVGLSPLLLSTSGILHEACILQSPHCKKWRAWTCVGLFHVLVATGVALLGVGASALQADNNNDINTTTAASDFQSVNAGIALLTASWCILVAAILTTVLTSRRPKNVRTFEAGTSLLYAVCFGLVCVGIRVLYSLVALTTHKASLNPVTGTLAIRVVLVFLPELLTVLCFIFTGILTRHGVSL